MKELTVILPLHQWDENIDKLLGQSLQSFYTTNKGSEAKLMFVGPEEVLKQVKESRNFPDPLDVVFINNEKSDFSVQINNAVENVTTKYFSVLEVDDQYTPTFFENIEKYITTYPEYMGFIPLNEIIDYTKQEEGAIGYANEAFWASSFSEKIGVLDEESIMTYFNMNVTGAVFKTEDFLEIGGLKPSIKISFWHEFLLRALHKDKILFVIPKVGYKHFISRPDSLSEIYRNTITEKEADWWFNLAQEEFYYKTDRNKKYEE